MAHPFLVLFTARSGSTALYGNLKSAPNVIMRPEIFGVRMLPNRQEQNDDNRIKFLRRYWAPFKQGATPEDAPSKGFKFQVTRNDAQFSQPARLVRVALQYKPRIVVLRRTNILKQAISSLNSARLLKLSHELREGKSTAHILPEDQALIDELKKTRLTLNIKHLQNVLDGIKASYAKLDKMAESFGDVHEITYEDYLANPDQVVCGVLSHIGIDPASYQPTDGYRKITSDSLEDVVENFDELKRFAAGTPYADMLV